MRLGKVWLAMVLAVSLLGAGAAKANEEDWGGRTPQAAHAKKKKKAAKKAKKAGKKSRSKAKGKKRHGSPKEKAARSHAPSHSAPPADDHLGAPGDLSNEKKDDLPAPQNTEPKAE